MSLLTPGEDQPCAMPWASVWHMRAAADRHWHPTDVQGTPATALGVTGPPGAASPAYKSGEDEDPSRRFTDAATLTAVAMARSVPSVVTSRRRALT